MKPILLGIVAIGVVGGITYFVPNDYSVQNVQPEVASTTQSVVDEVEEDALDKANQELERINTELDAEETRLLEERDRIDARLERILEIRSSFQ